VVSQWVNGRLSARRFCYRTHSPLLKCIMLTGQPPSRFQSNESTSYPLPQAWLEFDSMPFAEQASQLQLQPSRPARRLCPCRGATESPLLSPAQSYVNIDRDLRSVLRRRGTPLGFVALLEQQLVDAFSQDSGATVVARESTNYHRLLLHSVAQYLSLSSTSETVDGARLTVVRKATRCCSQFRRYDSPPPPKSKIQPHLHSTAV